MRARVVAAMVAITMVAISLAVRSAIDDDGGGSILGRGGDVSTLVCDPVAADACREAARQLGATVEVVGGGAALDRYGTSTVADPAAVWVTLAPVAEMAVERRNRSSLPALLGEAEAVAHSPIALLAWNSRAEALAPCQGSVGWRCLGEAAGRPWTDVGGQSTWGQVKVSLPDPIEDATGIVVLGRATAAFHDRTDISSAELDDPAYRDWLRRLAGSGVAQAADADRLIRTVLTQGPAAADALGALGAVAAPLVAAAGERAGDRLVSADEGHVALVAVALSPGSGAGAEAAEALRDALSDGWQDGEPPAGDDGLPSAGVLEALRQRWSEVR